MQLERVTANVSRTLNGMCDRTFVQVFMLMSGDDGAVAELPVPPVISSHQHRYTRPMTMQSARPD